MAHVHVPRSLAALFPGVPRRLELAADDVAGLIRALDTGYPGMWDRLCEPGPRLRQHMNAFVDGRPATLETALEESSVVHIIPAVSGGAAHPHGSARAASWHVAPGGSSTPGHRCRKGDTRS